MSAKTIAIGLLSVAALAACQPSGNSVVLSDPLLIGDDPAAPAEESLAALCTGDPGLQQQMVDAVNAARGVEGKTILAANANLTRIAQSHSCDMAATGRLSVAGSNGSNVVDRARSVDYPTCGVAQLISVQGSPAQAVAGWLAAEPTRVELLGQPSEEVGAGVTRGADGRLWWSVVLGDDCS